jgi:hypothetical protein
MIDLKVILILAACAVVLIGIFVVFAITERSAKKPTPQKPQPKADPNPAQVQPQPASPAVTAPAAPQPAQSKEEENGSHSITFRKHPSVLDYHRKKWSERSYSILSLDDSTPYNQDDIEIDPEDLKKILILKDLFDKKNIGEQK